MTDFGRVPILEVEQPAKEEKEIFDKPKAEPTNSEDDKKLKLKEHLKMCRTKSAEVRKAKAQEKKKNKRPVGRPKKVKDPMMNINMVVEPAPLEEPLETIQEESEDKSETEIFKQKDKLIQVLETPELIPPPPVPKAQPVFDMDMLLNKFDERMNDKLKAFQVPAPRETAPAIPSMGFDPNVLGFVTYMKDHEEKIRNEERTKYVRELEHKKNETLVNNTKKYFSRLPPRNFQPPAQPRQNDIWDDLLNPKRK